MSANYDILAIGSKLFLVYTVAGRVKLTSFEADGSQSTLFDLGSTATIPEGAPGPFISSVSPTSGATGSTLTLTGTNFTGATSVTVGGNAATSVNVVSSTTVTCVLPSHANGLVSVAIATPAGSNTSTNAFTYTTASAPDLVSLNVSTGSGAGTTAVTLTGTHFTADMTITFGGTTADSIVYINSTSMTCVAPIHVAGLVSVGVSNSIGSDTLPNSFTYVAGRTISTVSPSSGTQGTAITITGSGFTAATDGSVGGTALSSFVVVNDTTITAVVPAKARGAYDVVVNGGAIGSATKTNGFTTIQFRGANLVGGGAQGPWTSWTGANTATRSPGQGPQTPANYTFVTNADVDYCVSKGMNAFRLLFIHEAIQPEANATIPYAGALPNASRYSTYYTKFKALVDYITVTKGCTCLIDIHGAEGSFPTGWTTYYLRQFSMTPSASQEDGNTLANLWSQLATIFISNQNVWFGIQNEPTVSSAQWYPVAQACINAIRATGNTSKIVMPGINTDGARDWVSQPSDNNASSWLALTDSANNLTVQVHNYYDPDNSGTALIQPNTTYEPDTLSGSPATATNLGQARLTGVTDWARTNGKQIFIGEIALSDKDPGGADQTAQMTATWANTTSFINSNTDVIIGYAWWEYGNSGWAGNIFDLRKSGGVDNARMNVIKGDFVP